jgi:subtilisin-like proprotein convertase family protein
VPQATTIALALGGIGGGALTGGGPFDAVDGVATFSISVDRVGLGYTLTATDVTGGGGPLPSIVSDPFEIAPGPAATLEIVTDPGGGVSGLPFATQPVVRLLDAAGNALTADAGRLTASVASGPATILKGVLNAEVLGGQAGFATLRLDRVGTYELLFVSDQPGVAPLKSGFFDVRAGPAADFVVARILTDPVVARAPFTDLTLTAFDAADNLATGYTGAQKLIFTGASPAASGEVPTVTGENGVAKAFGETINVFFQQGVCSVAIDPDQLHITLVQEGETLLDVRDPVNGIQQRLTIPIDVVGAPLGVPGEAHLREGATTLAGRAIALVQADADPEFEVVTVNDGTAGTGEVSLIDGQVETVSASAGIPDPGIADAPLTVVASGEARVAEVRPTVRVAHPATGEVTLTLVAPLAESTILAANRGGAGANFQDTVFDDTATLAVEDGGAPFAGTFRPEVPFSDAVGPVGALVAGDWNLRAEDAAAGNAGTIDGWDLFLRTRRPAPAGSGARRVAAGSLNPLTDALTDVVVVNETASSFSILTRDAASGAFVPAPASPLGAVPVDVVVGRFDGDAFDDVAIVVLGSGGGADELRVFFNDGDLTDGTANAVFVDLAANGAVDLEAADLDGDSFTDVIVAIGGGGGEVISLYGGASAAAFGTTRARRTVPQVSALTTGDLFDNGPLIDVITVANDKLRALQQTSRGVFTVLNAGTRLGDDVRAIRSADLDGDGRVDLATANRGSDDLSVLFGEGDGDFGPVNRFLLAPTGSSLIAAAPVDLAVGDVTGDGIVDIVTVNENGTVSVFEGR